ELHQELADDLASVVAATVSECPACAFEKRTAWRRDRCAQLCSPRFESRLCYFGAIVFTRRTRLRRRASPDCQPVAHLLVAEPPGNRLSVFAQCGVEVANSFKGAGGIRMPEKDSGGRAGVHRRRAPIRVRRDLPVLKRLFALANPQARDPRPV